MCNFLKTSNSAFHKEYQRLQKHRVENRLGELDPHQQPQRRCVLTSCAFVGLALSSSFMPRQECQLRTQRGVCATPADILYGYSVCANFHKRVAMNQEVTSQCCCFFKLNIMRIPSLHLHFQHTGTISRGHSRLA